MILCHTVLFGLVVGEMRCNIPQVGGEVYSVPLQSGQIRPLYIRDYLCNLWTANSCCKNNWMSQILTSNFERLSRSQIVTLNSVSRKLLLIGKAQMQVERLVGGGVPSAPYGLAV